MLNLVKTLIRNNPIPNNIDKKPYNKAWDALTTQLKTFWDPKDEKTFSGLRMALSNLFKKKQLEENFKKLVKNLENAAYRLYTILKKQKPKTKFKDQTMSIINKNNIKKNKTILSIKSI
ncbi:MAG: hypothetical protein Q8L85_09795 [Alphaproteobacteria bacterium]|nr:hypothetical protein [Alphaproteobacteria bacterium]